MDTLFDVTLRLQVVQQLPHVMNGIHHRQGQSSRVVNVDPQERLCSRIVFEANGSGYEAFRPECCWAPQHVSGASSRRGQ